MQNHAWPGQIALDDAETNHTRNADLLDRGVLAPAEAQRTELALKQAREELYAAEDNLRIVREGVTRAVAAVRPTLW